jgi:hypothetical protein
MRTDYGEPVLARFPDFVAFIAAEAKTGALARRYKDLLSEVRK